MRRFQMETDGDRLDGVEFITGFVAGQWRGNGELQNWQGMEELLAFRSSGTVLKWLDESHTPDPQESFRRMVDSMNSLPETMDRLSASLQRFIELAKITENYTRKEMTNEDE